MKIANEELLTWYRAERRDLPWRRTRDPWAIWVSEIMLQQTRVEAVRERYTQFLARYPAPSDFAQASDDDVLAAWKGLGYYRRARLLREGARSVVELHKGSVPSCPDALLELPGVGDYTRGAIASIAFGKAEAAIDGNVERVLSRALAIETDPKKREARTRMRRAIAELHEGVSPGDVNQALMELGARVCLPKTPRCDECPWQRGCRANAEERTHELPRLAKRKPPTEVETEVLVARRDGLLLARRLPEGQINGGQLCLPSLGIPTPEAASLVPHLRASFGIDFRVTEPIASFKHGITKWRITTKVRLALSAPAQSRLRGRARELCYIDPEDGSLPTTTALRKALRAIADVRSD